MKSTNATVRKILQTAALEFQKKHGLVQVYNEGFVNEIVEQTVRECIKILANGDCESVGDAIWEIGEVIDVDVASVLDENKDCGNEPTNPRNIS